MPVPDTELPSVQITPVPLDPSYRKAGIMCGLAAALLGTLGLAGLVLGIPFLTSIVPGFKPIAFSASIGWIILGLVLAFYLYRPLRGILRDMVTAGILIIAVVTAIELPLNILGDHFLVELFFLKAGNAFFPIPSTPVSPLAVILILISSAALLLLLVSLRLPAYGRQLRNGTGILGSGVGLLGFTILLSYLYGKPFLYGTVLIPIAITSALAGLFTGISLIAAAGPESVPLSVITGSSVRAQLLRLLLPLVVAIIFVQNYLDRVLSSYPLVENTILVTILLVVFVLIAGFVVGKVSGVFSRNLEDERRRRQNAEDAERETREYLANLIRYANAPIITWNPELRITEFNRAFETLTGLSHERVIGQPLRILFPKESCEASMIHIRSASAGEKWEVVEIPILHCSGMIRTVLWNSANIAGPDGRVIATIAQGTDITDRKLAEESLRQTNEYLRNLLDYANAPIIVWDPAFRITRFNHAFERLTGRTEQEAVGKDLAILFPEASRDVSFALIRKTLTGERWEVVEIPILKVSGEIRIVLWNSANIVDPVGRIISTIAQGQDITDRKLTEAQREALIRELEQKNAELERFTYTVSHDLKSPLITIQGFVGMVEDDARKGDTVQMKKDLLRITTAAVTMQTLLSDLLELSKVGRIVGPAEKIGIGTIAHEAIDLLAIPLAERGVTVNIAEDLPEVKVDRTRIREVLVNLIENAIKFLGDRPDPVIRIGMEMKDGTPVFFVQDNGIGINPRYLERIFNLFEKLDTHSPGTGIGLTIVRRIIEFHGGKIWAESGGSGKGTTFKFMLPGVPRKGEVIR